MILLVSPSGKVQECAKALRDATGLETSTVSSLRQAIVRLRAVEVESVVIDQSLVEVEPEESEILLEHAATAVPVYINFAISGVERLTREVRAALARLRLRSRRR